jgi:hypothetical protein
MFSTSTMASSTRMPTTTARASSVTRFRLKPSQNIAAKVGMIESGSATAAMNVARRSRRNHHTTMTARSAPSQSMVIDESYDACASGVDEATSVNCTRGSLTCSSVTAARTASPTFTSLDPSVRRTARPTTGWPSRVVACVGSAKASRTSAIVDSRTERPSGSAMGKAARSPAVLTVPSVRTDCSPPPRVVRPPGCSCWMRASCSESEAGLTPTPCTASARRSTRTSRVTPPTRRTAPTPGTPKSRLFTVSSMNQLSSSSVRPAPRTANVTTSPPATFSRETTGSSMSRGRALRIRSTASRTSSSACAESRPSSNAMRVTETPSFTVDTRSSISGTLATASSTLRVTCDSIVVGDAPGKATVTVMVGRVRSGNCDTASRLKPTRPKAVSITKIRIAGRGVRMDHAEKFTCGPPTASPRPLARPS